MAGDVQFRNTNGSLVDSSLSVGGDLIPQNVDGIFDVTTKRAKMIIIVEKDATFQKLIQNRYILANAIIITGKGMPDLNTRWTNLLEHVNVTVSYNGY